MSSGNCTDAGMNGRNDAANGFVGFAPTMSGYSFGGFAGLDMRGHNPDSPGKLQASSALGTLAIPDLTDTNNA